MATEVVSLIYIRDEVQSVHLYVIKFASELWQATCFLLILVS
jgi:hypothetical protein